ncbi:MAG: DUF1080 domain-containing protein [Candidatus Hydrogenedentes bacterium]|nr:DUF1080 domain-containing protein [Candidatus Hydrogenedentota bacterium]
MQMRALLVLAAVGSFALVTVPCTAAEEEAWVPLFNGKDLSNWETKGGAATYHIEEDAIVGVSAPNTKNSFLCTKEHYADFILEFEFKASPTMNSGCQIRSNSLPDYKDGQVHGYQVELEDENNPRKWSGGIYDEGRRGWLYPTKENEELASKFSEAGKTVWKNGEWNTIRVEAIGSSIKTWVNGELRADLQDDMTPSGFIALQVHGVGDKTEPMTVRWRNIRIQEAKGK